MDLPTDSSIKEFILKILKNADLSSLSSKIIRKRCEEHFKTELSDRKKAIDKILMSCIDIVNKSAKTESSSEDSDEEKEAPAKKNSCVVEKPNSVSDSSHEDSESENLPSPQKSNAADGRSLKSEDDAVVAEKLKDEEWNFRQRRVKNISKKKRDKDQHPKKEKPKTQKGTSSYSRKCLLSPVLAEIVDATEMARHDVVKKMWEIVRERDLLDPKNRQFALCDEQLRKLFGGAKRVRMFGIMKKLKNHIKDQK